MYIYIYVYAFFSHDAELKDAGGNEGIFFILHR